MKNVDILKKVFDGREFTSNINQKKKWYVLKA